jgi:pyridoxamine 5'-phosphate oxidase family protein
MTFSPLELAYIHGATRARVATVAPDGQPDVVPVAFVFDGHCFYIPSRYSNQTRRARNVRAGNDKAALVIDDEDEAFGWAPRYLRVYGTTQIASRDSPGGRMLMLKVTPTVSWSFNLEGRPMSELASAGGPRKTLH